MKFLIVVLAALLSSSCWASGVPSRCNVVFGGTVLGSFSANVGEEELTLKTYPIPGTDLLAIARVFYTDELIGLRLGGAVLDLSTSIRLDVAKQAPTDPQMDLLAKGTVTRAILADFGNVSMLSVCKRALTDNAYANQIAQSPKDLEVLRDSCRSYVDLNGVNVISALTRVRGQYIHLTCQE